MKKQLLIYVLTLCLLLNLAKAQSQGSRIPYTLFNDFETGELFGWETYPYAQDIAFDALYFASKTPTYKDSKYALARPFKAHDTNELYQGFTKRLNIYTLEDTRVKAAVYFQSDRNAESLELSLGTFDGKRYMHKITNPKANSWLELDIPISSFMFKGESLKAGEHIQVITLKGSYPIVNYLFTYTILMDDFSINAERDRQFIALNPVSTNLNMFDISILNKHFFYGDNISLKVAPEGNVNLKQVKGTLLDSKGKVIKENVLFTRSGNEWVNNAIYKLTEKDLRGQWEIRLNGITDQNSEFNWSFRFLMPGKQVNGHPRLYFSAEELKKRLANEKSPVAKGILDHALNDKKFMKVDVDAIAEGKDYTAEALVGGPHARTSVGENSYAVWNNPNAALGNVIEEGSFQYAFTGDRAAGEQAKKALLKLCSFKKWNADWMLERKFWTYYPVGYTIKPVAYGYDMLYDLLTDSERAFVRKAIMDKGLKMFHRDMVEMNRMPSNQTNHIAVLAGGMGLAATAIYGDDPTNPNLEPYISGILTKTKTFIDRTYYEDGSYGEPKSGYMNMASRDMGELLPALERNFGVDYTTTTNFQHFYKYLIQASYSNGLMQDYGDGGGAKGSKVDIGGQIHSWWLVNRIKNPILYSYVKPFWEAGKGGYLSYYWYRDDITPISRETLPPSKFFAAQGMVMRSGWDDTSTVLSTRVGPNANHYHYDQGSFQIMKNGETLLTDPAYGPLGYYANLEFLSYHVQANAHNVMLVDHDPESQTPAHYDNGIKALRDWPKVLHLFNGKDADGIESELSTVYKGKLEKYARTILSTKSGPIFLFDEVKSKTPAGHVYDWIFHAPPGENNETAISYSNGRMIIDRPKAKLTMDVVSPVIAASKIYDKGVGKVFYESFLDLTSKPDLEHVNFLAVILPESKSESGSARLAPVTTRLDAPGWIGAKMVHTSGSDIGFFHIGSENGTAAGFTTDAKRFTASYDKFDVLNKIYFEGTSISGNGLSFTADQSVRGTIALTNSGIDAEIKSARGCTIKVLLSGKPSIVQSNGLTISDWTYDELSKMLTLKIAGGTVPLIIKK
jgi:hypothetical protein